MRLPCEGRVTTGCRGTYVEVTVSWDVLSRCVVCCLEGRCVRIPGCMVYISVICICESHNNIYFEVYYTAWLCSLLICSIIWQCISALLYSIDRWYAYYSVFFLVFVVRTHFHIHYGYSVVNVDSWLISCIIRLYCSGGRGEGAVCWPGNCTLWNVLLLSNCSIGWTARLWSDGLSNKYMAKVFRASGLQKGVNSVFKRDVGFRSHSL